MIIHGEKRAYEHIGQRPADDALRGVADRMEAVVVHTGRTQFRGCVARRGRGSGLSRGGGFRDREPSEGKRGTVVAFLGKVQRAHGGTRLKALALTQNIQIQQGGVAVAAVQQPVGHITADYAELALRHQKRSQAHQ